MITATLDLKAAAQQLWDVIVVGAGPAGAFAAYRLAQHRVNVLLVDKASFPRWKVCGCCLNGRALSILQSTDLAKRVASWGGVPLRQVVLACRDQSAILPLRSGMALSRETFDAALVQEAKKEEAAFLPGTHARLGYSSPTLRQVILRQGNQEFEATTRLVLAADGLGGRLIDGATPEQSPTDALRNAVSCRSRMSNAAKNSRIGAGVIAATGSSYYCEGIVFMACGAGGYVGVVRLEDGRLAVAAAFEPGFLKKSGTPAKAASAILRETDQPAIPSLAELPWRGTPPLTRRPSRLAAHRLLVLGDAAGFVEPFTGEGMAWALGSAAAVIPLALRAIRSWEPVLQERWTMEYQRVVARRQWACRTAASLLRRPRLTYLLVQILSCLPTLAGPVLAQLNRPVVELVKPQAASIGSNA